VTVESFEYVGPRELAPDNTGPSGQEIRSLDDLLSFIDSRLDELNEPFTFVVDRDGNLLLAPRRSEHVRAAGGLSVLAAGEIAFDAAGRVTYSSNQSIGYRPHEASWQALAEALRAIGVEVPDASTTCSCSDRVLDVDRSTSSRTTGTSAPTAVASSRDDQMSEHLGWPRREDYPYLVEATLELRDFPYEHDHCVLDWAKITNDPDPSHWHPGRKTFLAGYLVQWQGRSGQMEDWICPTCAYRYRARFMWTLIPDADDPSD
jgi:hypothetical protein